MIPALSVMLSPKAAEVDETTRVEAWLWYLHLAASRGDGAAGGTSILRGKRLRALYTPGHVVVVRLGDSGCCLVDRDVSPETPVIELALEVLAALEAGDAA